MILVGSKADL